MSKCKLLINKYRIHNSFCIFGKILMQLYKIMLVKYINNEIFCNNYLILYFFYKFKNEFYI